MSTVLRTHLSFHGCFYHVTQCAWRKVQNLGLITPYRSNDQIKHFCGMSAGLAFLPSNEVANGMDYLMENIPDVEGPKGLADYSSSTYVFITYHHIQPPSLPDGKILLMCFKRVPPLFPPQLKSVQQATIDEEARANNLWENSGNEIIRRIRFLYHSTAVIKDSHSEPPRKWVKRATKE